MGYIVAGIDVHKRMLAVIIAEAKVGELEFERRRFQTTASGLREWVEWLKGKEVQEAVMESTAQYWRPVWLALEGVCKLHLAQARVQRSTAGAQIGLPGRGAVGAPAAQRRLGAELRSG